VPSGLGRVLQGYFGQQELQQELQQEIQAEIQRELVRQQKLLNLLQSALDLSEDELRAWLKSTKVEKRFVAAYAVGERRLFWQDDLIRLLKDNSDGVRQSARRSLIILSFLLLNPDVASAGPGKPGPPADQLVKPADFGPLPGAKVAARNKAADEWTEWWNDHGKSGLKTLADSSKEGKADELSDRLVKAEGQRQKKVLKEYVATSGVEYTQAIAHAIPRLSGDARKEAREGLADRLSDRKDTTLLRYLEDDDPEIRRAAALALGMRDSKETVAVVAKLLLDPDPSVVRATCASLRSLTGEDYGPPPNATEEEKQDALKKYQAWRPRK
jgi:HEAT repeat protein